MANTFTTHYSLIKPEVGSDTNAWGTHSNTNYDSIDGQLYKCIDYTLTTTQTMSGALTLPSNGLNVGSGQLNVTGGNVSMSGNVSAVNATFSGTLSVTGAVTFGSTVLLNANPTLALQAATKQYADLMVPLAGGTMTGNLSIINSTTEMTLTLGSSGGYYFGNATLAGFKNSGGTARVSWNISTGDFTAAGNVTAYSDAKLKENVKTIENAVDLVNQMRGVYYDRIDTGEAGVGVIAQEMRDVVPEVVVENDGTLSVAYGNLVGVLIEAVKELSARVEKLEAR